MTTRAVKSAMLAVSMLSMLVTGCKKTPPPAPPAPPPKTAEVKTPPAEKPSIDVFVAEPSTIVRGNPATLRWAVSGATDISIDQGIGSVPASGTRAVYPSQDATYTLVARGVGGVSESRVTVRVSDPRTAVEPPAPPKPASVSRDFSEWVSTDVKDAYFDFDSFDVRDDAKSVLTADAEALRQIFGAYGGRSVVIEGHCDERGSDAYNVALGDRRAQAAVEFLKNLGLSADRMKTTSYGKERPQCTDSTEECWQKNRRVHIAPQ